MHRLIPLPPRILRVIKDVIRSPLPDVGTSLEDLCLFLNDAKEEARMAARIAYEAAPAIVRAHAAHVAAAEVEPRLILLLTADGHFEGRLGPVE